MSASHLVQHVPADASASPVQLQGSDHQKPAAHDNEHEVKEISYKLAAARFVYGLGLLYVFLFGLDLMGTSFKVLGGRRAGKTFSAVENPIAGLMVGLLATVLVQSSSTSTSIVVSMVGAGLISVKDAVPIIMGANIGTSVTNTLMSVLHARNAEHFERAFAGATIHDFFNFLSVAVLLPIELVSGLLRHLAGQATDALTGGSGSDWEGPIKRIVGPLVKLVLVADKKKIKAAATGGESSGSLIKGGVFADAGMSDELAGSLCLIISLALLVTALILLVRLLSSALETRVALWIKKGLDVHPVLGMIIGCGLTILVQSSSITTSAMVPLVAVGLVDLEHIFPLTLGANVGTTVTGLLAALTQDSSNALQIALVHLFFNISGILVWYPVPFLRRVPLALARALSAEVRVHRWVGFVYILGVFFVVPINLIGFSEGGLALTIVGLLLNVGIIGGALLGVWASRNHKWCWSAREEAADDLEAAAEAPRWVVAESKPKESNGGRANQSIELPTLTNSLSLSPSGSRSDLELME